MFSSGHAQAEHVSSILRIEQQWPSKCEETEPGDRVSVLKPGLYKLNFN